MHHGGSDRPGRNLPLGPLEVQVAGVGGNPVLVEEPAPAPNLVLAGGPCRTGLTGTGEGEEATGPQGQQHPVALRPPAVQVDGYVRPFEGGVKRGEWPGVHHLVDRPCKSGEGRKPRGCGQHPAMVRESVGERPERRHGREKVAEAQSAEDDERWPPPAGEARGATAGGHSGSRPPL